jgi:hypothetical protein
MSLPVLLLLLLPLLLFKHLHAPSRMQLTLLPVLPAAFSTVQMPHLTPWSCNRAGSS